MELTKTVYHSTLLSKQTSTPWEKSFVCNQLGENNQTILITAFKFIT
jgi:hypothetical protein